MTTQRHVEVFSAGCALCEETVATVKQMACSCCEVTVLDMALPEIAQRAKSLGIKRVPAVVVDGKLADCCTDAGCCQQTLRDTGIGQPIE